LTARLGIGDGILAAGAGEILAAMLPERGQSADGGRVVAALQEIAQAFALRSAVCRVFRIVDVDLELGGEEVREAGVGKIQHEAGTPDEVDEVINEAQVDGSHRTNKPSSPADSLELAVDRFVERSIFPKYVGLPPYVPPSPRPRLHE
jgi:hypothetical protein